MVWCGVVWCAEITVSSVSVLSGYWRLGVVDVGTGDTIGVE